jgi:predicted ATP-dependent endonuclease of OLD family
VEGFTSIRSAALELNDVNVLVGANGAGKSNLIRALGVLGRIVDGELGLYVGQRWRGHRPVETDHERLSPLCEDDRRASGYR